ncbi:MAG: gephyrin-like molybdotransferase Glp [Planctomycetota bacterium]
MLDYTEALSRVLANINIAPARELNVLAAGGLVLAQDIIADADMPAFDRSAMDGFAVRSEDTKTPDSILTKVGEQSAGGDVTKGTVMNRALAPGECAAIYTGAPIPAGADAVVMVERTREENGKIYISTAVARGDHVRYQGEDVKKGELLITAGRELRPQEIAICATFGYPRVRAVPKPKIIILSTGDELVPIANVPGPGQIRDSNAAMVAAQAARAGGEIVDMRTVRDELDIIKSEIESAAARADVLVLSGGVSMGAYDYVAPALQQLGFAGGFHKVKIKPGKPIWFGERGAVRAFGLPGNPVSSFVTFELFVRPAIAKMLGQEPGPMFKKALVEGGPTKGADREQFVPAIVKNGLLTFIPWTSSADFIELSRANALARVPIGAAPAAGDEIAWLPI